MANIWEKWISATGGMRLIIAFLYAFVSLSISLHHTCRHSPKNIYNCQSACAVHRSDVDGHSTVLSGAAFFQNASAEETESHLSYCPACLYSLISKAFESGPNTSLLLVQAIVKTQVMPQLSYVEQLQWLTSVSLRAPPVTIS